MRFRTRMLAAAAALVLLAGCSQLTPPKSYVAAQRAAHDQEAHVFTTFEKDHPDEADAAKNLYQADETLISNAEKGLYPK